MNEIILLAIINMRMTKPEYKKITQVLNYIAAKEGREINYMKALKLLYLADRLHLRKYGRLITDDRLVAMENGTLGSQAKDIIVQSDFLPHVVYEYSDDKLKRNLDAYKISSASDDFKELSESDIECVDSVLKEVGEKNQFELKELTHNLPEWKRHQFTIEEEGENKVVDLELKDLFKKSNNDILDNLYSQSDEELILSQEFFAESLEQKMQLEN